MLTDEQVMQMIEADRFNCVLCALIEKRVSASTLIDGLSKGGAAALVADTRFILAKVAAT